MTRKGSTAIREDSRVAKEQYAYLENNEHAQSCYAKLKIDADDPCDLSDSAGYLSGNPEVTKRIYTGMLRVCDIYIHADPGSEQIPGTERN